jgi:predicted secreted protein
MLAFFVKAARLAAFMALILLPARADGGEPTYEQPTSSFEDGGDYLKVLAVDQELRIDLRGNRTTGYSWKIVHMPDFLVQIGDESYVSEGGSKGTTGVGGVSTWRFLAKGKGADTLRFVQARPWEKDAPPSETVEYRVIVR